MGDLGTSDTTVPDMVLSWGHSFSFPDPDPSLLRPAHELSAPSSSTDLHGRPPPHLRLSPSFSFPDPDPSPLRPAHEMSAPSASTGLYSRRPPHLQLNHHPAVSFSYQAFKSLKGKPWSGFEEWRNHQASQAASGSVELRTSAVVGEDDLFTYPRGEADAVTITARDLEGLQPGKFVSVNIIDFYVKYLNIEILSQDLEKQQQIHFFNSFFFTKFLGSTEFGSRFLREVDYEQLQRWIGDVNLFEKEYIFIPVVQRSHWSLIVIYHLGKLVANTLGEEGGPCILHLDPIKGKHECFEGQVKGFLHHACLIMLQDGCHLGKLLTLNKMKYVQAKVPQQDNGYDCGMYVLHYIEVFLSKWTSSDSSFFSCQGGDEFTNLNFKTEVSFKRNQIQSLILEHSGRVQGHDSNSLDVQKKSQEDIGLVEQLRVQRDCSKSRAKETKNKKFTQEETSVLLKCMCNIGRFGLKEKQGAMHWNLISQEVNQLNCERLRSDDQCRRRFDTLLKAYKKLDAFCKKENKTFGEITNIEKENMNLATPFKKENEAWFIDLRTICCQRASSRGKPTKRQRLKCDGDIDMNKHESSHLDLVVQRPLPLEPIGSVHPKKAASKQVAISGFGALEKELKWTLLNMIQASSTNWNVDFGRIANIGALEEICRMLAIVQDQKPLEIFKHVYELRDLELVTMVGRPSKFGHMDEWKDYQEISLSHVKAFKKFGEKVLRKNPHLRTFWRVAHGDVFATTLFPLQQIRVLSLYECQELEHVDLGNFPELRCLHIHRCEKLKSIKGWEVVKKLGWIKINRCNLYNVYPDVQCLSSLREVTVDDYIHQIKDWQLVDFSKCVLLRSLRLSSNRMVESMELEALKFLEDLSFFGCFTLSTIHGLKGLHALAKLDLAYCGNLKRVPELGCLKALTHLSMRGSGIVEIPGVGTLHLMTSLDLEDCKSLESLPFLGHLKALAHLNLGFSGIQEILGVEDLINLKTLKCYGSRLLTLPNLQHLPHLKKVDIWDTPLSRERLPLKHLWENKYFVCSSWDQEISFVDEGSYVSDVSDVSPNANSSNED